MRYHRIFAVCCAAAALFGLAQCSSYDPGSWDKVATTIPASETCVAACRVEMARDIIGDTTAINTACRLGDIADTARVCVLPFRDHAVFTWPVANTATYDKLTAGWQKFDMMTWHARATVKGKNAIVACPDQTWLLVGVNSVDNARDILTEMLTQAAQGYIESQKADALFATVLNDTTRAVAIVNATDRYYSATISAYSDHIGMDVCAMTADGTPTRLSDSLSPLIDTDSSTLTDKQLADMFDTNALTLAAGIKTGALVDYANRRILPKMSILDRAKASYALTILGLARPPITVTVSTGEPVLTVSFGMANPQRMADRVKGMLEQANIDATVKAGTSYVSVSKKLDHEWFAKPDSHPEISRDATALLAAGIRDSRGDVTVNAVMTDSVIALRCNAPATRLPDIIKTFSQRTNPNNTKH